MIGSDYCRAVGRMGFLVLAVALIALAGIALAGGSLLAQEAAPGNDDLKAATPAAGSTALSPPWKEPGSNDDWRELLVALGANWPAGKSVSEILGHVPTAVELEQAGAIEPGLMLSIYNKSDERVRLIIKRFVLARLRELGRRGAVAPETIAYLIGPEDVGVAGSLFFGVPPISSHSYNALVSYIEYMAIMASKGGFVPSESERERIGRALQAYFAVLPAADRVEFQGFDVVFSIMLRDLELNSSGGAASSDPGVFWLYLKLRESANMDFLPAPSPELEAEIRKDEGRLLARARAELKRMPSSLAGLTVWRFELG